MKKIAIAFILSVFCITANAATGVNPFFGDARNQVALNIGQGVDSGIIVPPPFRLVPFYFLHLQYSQPTTFFRLHARQSLNFGQTLGFGEKYHWHWNKFTIPMVFLSEDVALFHGQRWYTSAGIGAGMQAQQNERLGAKLLFQFKLAAGWRFTERCGTEIFVQHFSNGNTAKQNHSYAFYGLGMTYSF